MTATLSTQQLLGLDDSHVQTLPCKRQLQADVAQAFSQLVADAAHAGFNLQIASAFRSFDRQLTIFNGKALCERPVHDDVGRPLARQDMSAIQWLDAILRFSALPGTSRHHWGTDLDVYDAAALPPGKDVELTPEEVAPGGVFDPLHCWLDERMAHNQSHGFFRPYSVDRGGVACERWHLSYAPLSLTYARQLTAGDLRRVWLSLPAPGLALMDDIAPRLETLLTRYVDVGSDWCGVVA